MKKKICVLCGKEFVPRSNRQKYCDDVHYQPCPVCGKLTKISNLYVPKLRACSYECRQEEIKKTSLQRYGVDNVAKVDSVKEKVRKTLLERYGVDNYFKTADFKLKYRPSEDLDGLGVHSDSVK